MAPRFGENSDVTLSLLLPEWQGSGTDPMLAAGARELAARLSPPEFLEIDAPSDEALTKLDGVTGLSSIGPRAKQTLEVLAERQPSRLFVVGGTCGVDLARNTYTACRASGTCSGALGGTCSMTAADGAACSTGTAGPACLPPARCVSGRCTLSDPVACAR